MENLKLRRLVRAPPGPAVQAVPGALQKGRTSAGTPASYEPSCSTHFGLRVEVAVRLLAFGIQPC